MIEKREKHRHRFIPVTQFPVNPIEGDLITAERRMLPTMRVNKIEVKQLSCLDLFSELR